MTDTEAQEKVLEVAKALAGLTDRLEEIVGALPPSPDEVDLSDLVDDPEVAAEVRRVIACVLTDNLRPAVDDLLAASRYSRAGNGETGR